MTSSSVQLKSEIAERWVVGVGGKRQYLFLLQIELELWKSFSIELISVSAMLRLVFGGKYTVSLAVNVISDVLVVYFISRKLSLL